MSNRKRLAVQGRSGVMQLEPSHDGWARIAAKCPTCGKLAEAEIIPSNRQALLSDETLALHESCSWQRLYAVLDEAIKQLDDAEARA